jgi:hypothetical protein
LNQEERKELRSLRKPDALNTLRTLLFEFDSRYNMREKDQLHRMLEKELWIFGDEYTHGVSEIGLTTALSRHLPRLGRLVGVIFPRVTNCVLMDGVSSADCIADSARSSDDRR